MPRCAVGNGYPREEENEWVRANGLHVLCLEELSTTGLWSLEKRLSGGGLFGVV